MAILVGLDPAKIEVGMIVKARVEIYESFGFAHPAGTVGIVTKVETLNWPRKGEVRVTVQFEELSTVVTPPIFCEPSWLLPV